MNGYTKYGTHKHKHTHATHHTHTHTMDNYSTLKRNEILTQALTWINFEDIMLSEISQT